MLENAEASRWELLRTEWLYDVVLLTNDFRLWMQRLDKGFGTATGLHYPVKAGCLR